MQKEKNIFKCRFKKKVNWQVTKENAKMKIKSYWYISQVAQMRINRLGI